MKSKIKTEELFRFFNKPVLLREDYFDVLKSYALYSEHEESEKRESYLNIENNVAILKIHGILVESTDSMPWYGDFLPCDVLLNDLKQVKKSNVENLILDINSPGGDVDGVQNLADYIYYLRNKLNILSVINSQACSAGYWLASAAHKIGLISETCTVGSIGVAVAHVDTSKYLENQGITVTHITAGKYKRITASEKPIDDEAFRYIQIQVDKIYSVFLDRVSKFRGDSVENILSFADGKIFIGTDSLENKMVDGLLDFNFFIGEKKDMGKLNIFKFKLQDEEKPEVEDDEEKPEMEDDEEKPEMEDDEEKPEMEDDEEKPEVEDDEEKPEMEDDEEKPEVEDDEEEIEDDEKPPVKKDMKKKSYYKNLRHGAKLERKRVAGILSLGLSGKELKAAILSGDTEEKIALRIVKGDFKQRTNKRSRKSSTGEGYYVSDNRAPSAKSKKEKHDDEDLNNIKSGAKTFMENVRRIQTPELPK